MSAITISCSVSGTIVAGAVSQLELQSLPVVGGTPQEGTTLNVDTSDTWTFAGQPASIIAREYRLMAASTIVLAAQSSPIVPIPVGTGGQTYSLQMRALAVESGGVFSDWITIESGTVLYMAPQATGSLAPVVLSTGEAVQNIDFAPFFIGTDLTYTVQTGPLPLGSTLSGSVLSLATAALFGPSTLVIRATNPAGNADQSLDVTIILGTTVPDAFAPGDWTVTDLGTGDDVRIDIATLPADGGAPLIALQHNIDSAGWVDFTNMPAPGSFDILDQLTINTLSSLRIRAVNTFGAAADSDAKSVTPTLTFGLNSTAEGEIEIEGASGEITITVTSPSAYATYDVGAGPGVFTANSADLASGPLNLAPPQILDDGAPASGETLTSIPGLWIYDGSSAAPSITSQWHRGVAAIAGATQTSYTLGAADEGQDITLEETAIGANGTRSAISAATSVPNSVSNTLVSDAFSSGDGYVLNDDVPTASVDWTAIYQDADITATVTSLGLAEINGDTSANRHIRVGYAGVISNNQAIEVTFDSLMESNRADPVISVRRSGGSTIEGDSVRAFFWSANSRLLLGEFSGGSVVQEITINSVPLTQDDVIRVEVSGTTATVAVNGATVATLTGLAVTGGVPTWGAYLGPNANNYVRFSRAQIEDLT